MYKILHSLDQYSIQFGNSNIPIDLGNKDYQQFIKDVAEQGIGIVEGPDVVQPSYAELRAPEYPPIADQLDKIYHSGVTAWKKNIKAIKDKHPKTITGGTTIGDVPDWVQEAADNWTFNKQLREYVAASERLSQYILSEGRPELTEDVIVSTEEVWNEARVEYDTFNTTETVITQTAIEPLEATVEVSTTNPETMEVTTETVPNPAIVKDEEERAAAQAIVDKTPQPIIDTLSTS